MYVETLIYAYLAICVCMILFNCVCIQVFSRREKKTKKASKSFIRCVKAEIDRLDSSCSQNSKHIRYLKRKLRHIGNLVAFDEALEELHKENTHGVIEYISTVYPVFVYLSEKYRCKDEIRVTFFLYILRKYHVLHHKPNKRIDMMVLDLIKSRNIYLRQNALETVFTTGNVDYVLRAIRTIDEMKVYHNSKLITDGLMKFTGSRRKLAKELWGKLSTYSVEMQVAIINYFRFQSGKHHTNMYALLKNENTHDEVRFACIRYFGKYPYKPAQALLLELADEKAVSRWEYAAIATQALSKYPRSTTIDALKHNLSSHEWYVRFNAARSLEELGVNDKDVADVFGGHDRYAQEMLRYRMDQRNTRREEAV